MNVVLSHWPCVLCPDGISSGAGCVTSHPVTHAGWSCWQAVRIVLGGQGYPFFLSVWVLSGCLIKSFHQSTKHGASLRYVGSKEILLYEVYSLFMAIELMGWVFWWRVHVWQLLQSSRLHRAYASVTVVGRGTLQVFCNWDASGEFHSPDRAWNMPSCNKQAQSGQNDSDPHLHLQLLNCCCPSREDFSFAGNCIDWLWLGKRSDRTHSKRGAA